MTWNTKMSRVFKFYERSEMKQKVERKRRHMCFMYVLCCVYCGNTRTCELLPRAIKVGEWEAKCIARLHPCQQPLGAGCFYLCLDYVYCNIFYKDIFIHLFIFWILAFYFLRDENYYHGTDKKINWKIEKYLLTFQYSHVTLGTIFFFILLFFQYL